MHTYINIYLIYIDVFKCHYVHFKEAAVLPLSCIFHGEYIWRHTQTRTHPHTHTHTHTHACTHLYVHTIAWSPVSILLYIVIRGGSTIKQARIQGLALWFSPGKHSRKWAETNLLLLLLTLLVLEVLHGLKQEQEKAETETAREEGEERIEK